MTGKNKFACLYKCNTILNYQGYTNNYDLLCYFMFFTQYTRHNTQISINEYLNVLATTSELVASTNKVS